MKDRKKTEVRFSKNFSESWRKYLLRNKYILGGIAISVILTIISFALITSTVSATNRIRTKKVFTSVKIEKGDTLWSIAKQYKTNDGLTLVEYIDEIKRSNGLWSDNITEGHFVIVPYEVVDFEYK